MKLINLRVLVSLLATLTAIIFILLSFLYPNYAILCLTIEAVLLPAIYIVGNYYTEDYIKRQSDSEFTDLAQSSDKLEEKYINELINNVQLETELHYIKNGNKKVKKN